VEADAAAAAATRAELEEGTFSEAAASTPKKQPPREADKPAVPAPAAPVTAPVTVSKNQKGTGCCGLGPSEDVVEPTSAQPAVSAPDAQNPAQNGSGVSSSASSGDGWGFTSLSWAPLLLPRAPKKADLLLGLMLRGAYSEPSVCEAVAHEVCAEDAAAAATFLNALTGTKSAKLGSSISGVVDIWLSQLVPRLLHLDPWPIPPRDLVGRTLSFLPDHPFTRTMFAFLECHCASLVAQAAIDAAKTQAALEDMKAPALKSKEAADGAKPAAALPPATASLALPVELMNEVYACLAHLLSSSMRSRSAYLAFLPLWKLTSGSVAPAEALMGTATYLERTVFSQTASKEVQLATHSGDLPAPSKLPPGWLPELDADDQSTPGSRRLSTEEGGATPGGATPAGATPGGATPMNVDVDGNERIVLALASLFVEQPDRLTGFQCLVPSIFETYLVKGSPLRARLCKQLVEGGMDAATVQRISEDDRLVAQRFFWSAPGLKLFGDHPDLQDEGKLTALLTDAVRQQPAILSAFMLSVAARATTSAANGATKAPVSIKTVCKVGVIALCTNVRELGIVKHSINPPVPINEAVAVLLEIALTSGEAYDGVLCGCDADDDATTALLDAFAAHYFRVKLGVAARSRMSLEKESSADSSAADDSFRKLKHSASARLDEALRSPQLGATDQPLKSTSPQSSSRRRRSLSAESVLWELDGPLMSTWPRGNTDGPEQSLLQSRRPSNGHAAPTDALPTSEASDETRRTELENSTPGVAPNTAAKSPRQASSLPSSPQLYSTPIEFDLPQAPLTPAAGSTTEQTSETPDKTAVLADSPDKTGSTELPEETKRNERVVMCLATLFVARPAKLTAFAQLVPQVFDTYLALGSAPRAELNKLLMEKAFDENLEKLFSETDELVKAPFFWHVDTMRLCTKQCIQKEYRLLNSATLQTQDGVKLHLYSRLLALLLKLAAAGSADAVEITRRTKEVLDQFERNPDQQHFLLSIFLTLQARVDTCIEDFADFPLPVLSEVAANGVHTIASVRAPGMELCEKAMTTLLEGYVTNKKPADWKDLFREATNVAFMVKYMFRESVTLAKTIFTFIADDKNQYKKLPQAAEAQATIKKLVSTTLQAYGNVGLYDPAQLATIDFLNHPEELVALVQAGKELNANQPDMLLLADIATNWMRYMIDRGFPPLTPHHTQSFVVLMMARFFGDVVKPPSPAESSEGALLPYKSSSWSTKIMGEKSKLNAKTFIAQMATGEGKSIVIAMLAVFMVKQFGMKVHVLENNEGLLLRDYATNAPFYDRFGIKSGKDLSDPDTQVLPLTASNCL
jgi:hypothetical protein